MIGADVAPVGFIDHPDKTTITFVGVKVPDDLAHGLAISARSVERTMPGGIGARALVQYDELNARLESGTAADQESQGPPGDCEGISPQPAGEFVTLNNAPVRGFGQVSIRVDPPLTLVVGRYWVTFQ
jgi:hypothetical protein